MRDNVAMPPISPEQLAALPPEIRAVVQALIDHYEGRLGVRRTAGEPGAGPSGSASGRLRGPADGCDAAKQTEVGVVLGEPPEHTLLAGLDHQAPEPSHYSAPADL